MRYGTPYRGSKNAIAPWVVEHLPAADVLVDLFAGGCAVTHAAMLSGRFGRFVANDLTEAPQVFVDAINGEFEGFSTVPTREEFLSSDDDALRLMYSFGNNREDYLWSRELEPVKVSASRMVLAPSVHERKRAYRDFMRALRSYVESSCRMPDVDRKHDGDLEGPQSLERLQSLESLQNLDGLLTVSRVDYRAVGVPGGATVYADPPYRGTNCRGYHDAGLFDFDAFDTWLSVVPFMVVVSEYEAPAGCVEVARIEKRVKMDARGNARSRAERLFVQERFADEYRERMGSETLFGATGL